ncbi:tail fiber domain-containing protein [Pseudomonas syringae pv. tomato]|uniref:tail fiber domain-containing protein n=1 Tax=Pseudomonas syringae group genomosp. 3 TaxID=251701 RepID=UPI002AFFD3FE|nr:tail fiber domain-containing protein [Pseudomonas syringae group genomosp. 3]MEA1762260.1 tail fiber domain-containing protein [Pseudomonas syringae pv. tomato]
MPWYKTGTVSVTQNSNAVIGSGTAFIANSRVGDGFRGPDGGWYEVTNIASDTAMSISPNYQGATNGAGGYALAPLQGYVKESADRLRALVLQYGEKLAALGTTGNYDILPVAKGGTGATDSASALTSLGMKGGAYDALIKSIGFRGAPVGYNVQGLYMGWNGNNDGGANYICNRGGGLGGHAWWSVNSDNTAAGPVMTYSYSGVLSVAQLSVVGSPIALSSGGTSATTAAGARTNLGLGSAAIENTVPITKGGTGGTDGPSARAGLGLGTTDAVTIRALELTHTTPWVDFHYNNTAADYDVRLINDSAGTLTLDGRFGSKATWCRTGLNGSRGTTGYNFNWTGSYVDVYIDATYIGSMTLFQSDYRLKKYIKEFSAPSFLDRIDAYRIVTYQRKNFGDVFKGGSDVYQGLIAHEAKEVNPLAASGEKDGVDENGNPRIQQLDPMALITDLMGAVKELRAELAALKASIQPAPEPVTA